MDMDNTKIIYAIAILRTSSSKQGLEGDSHAQQKEQITRRVNEVSEIIGCRIEIKRWFKFSASAGGEFNTQPILEALNYCKDSKNKIKYLFFRSIDRGTRGGAGVYGQLKAEFARYGVQFLDSYGIIDTTVINTLQDYGFKYTWSEYSRTASNELMVAEGGKDHRRETLTRLIGAEIRFTKLGYTMGPSPVGYQMEKEDTENGQRKILKPHPVESLWILRGYELRIQGNLSDEDIIKDINSMGYKSRRTRIYNPLDRTRVIGYKEGKTLTTKHFQKIIQNPIYAGIYVHRWTNYKPIKGKFRGLVSIDVFNAANKRKIAIIEEDGKIMIAKGKLLEWQAVKNKDNPMYPYKRQVLCPTCRYPLLGSASKGKSGQYFPAYHCGRKINGKRHNFRVKLRDFNDTIESFVQKVRFNDSFSERFKDIALEELEKRENQLSTDTISCAKQIEAKENEIQNLKEKIKMLTSVETIRMFEEDIEKLRLEKANLINVRDYKEDKQVDTQVAINYTNYFMEHLEDLLLGGPNPQKNAALFGLLFDETPTYQQLIDGTPKLACLFKLNEDFTTTKSLDVSRVSQEWNTFESYFNRVYQTLQQYQVQIPVYVTA